MSRRRILTICLAFGMLFAAGWLVMVSNRDAFVYSKRVSEILRTPERFQNIPLRVEGQLANGSIRFREEPCEYRFQVLSEGQTLEVAFPQCVVPDTFRDGMGIDVVVEGRLRGAEFHATQVIPRCPSRYEMDERARRGESMPTDHPSGAST